MATFKLDQLRRAAILADRIQAIETASNEAEDMTVTLDLGAPSMTAPLGKDYLVKVNVPIHATSIRAALFEQLVPLHAELRALGIEVAP